MRIWRVDGERRTEITGLKPQAHKLIRYMAEQSRLNNGTPVAATHTELIHMMLAEVTTNERSLHRITTLMSTLDRSPRRPRA